MSVGLICRSVVSCPFSSCTWVSKERDAATGPLCRELDGGVGLA